MTINNTIDARFANLEAIWRQGISLKLFADPKRASAFEHVHALLRIANEKDLQDLIKLLTYLHWDLKAHIPSDKEGLEIWTSRRKQLQEQLGLAQLLLGNENLEIGKRLINDLNSLAAGDSNYREYLLKQIEIGTKTAFVVEKSRQRDELATLIEANGHSSEVAIFRLDGFVKLPATDFERVIVLAAPQKLSENFMRGLLFGGVSKHLEFVSPNWLSPKGSKSISQPLAGNLTLSSMPPIHIEGEVFEKEITEAKVEDTATFILNRTDFEKFVPLGDTDCRLIELPGDLVIPIELDAERISVLAKDGHGMLKVEFRDPFKTLSVGDVVFNLRDGAEEQFLMDIAGEKLGQTYIEFINARNTWKKEVRLRIESQGLNAVILYLKNNGVSTADYLNDWLENDDFVSPRSKADWANLLKALGFEKVAIDRYVFLTTTLRSTLISIGQSARLAMADAISSEDWEKIIDGQIVSKTLSEYGDAEFLVSRVDGIGTNVVSCPSGNIRKIMGN